MSKVVLCVRPTAAAFCGGGFQSCRHRAVAAAALRRPPPSSKRLTITSMCATTTTNNFSSYASYHTSPQLGLGLGLGLSRGGGGGGGGGAFLVPISTISSTDSESQWRRRNSPSSKRSSIRASSTHHHHVNDSGSVDSPLIKSMESKIKEQLNADSVTVKDAYGDGRHVSIDVISSVFEGESAVSRQRMVYKAIWEELQNTVHAVDQMTTKTPSEAATNK